MFLAPMVLFAAEAAKTEAVKVDGKLIEKLSTSSVMEDKLFVLEYKHWLFAAQRPEIKKDDVLKSFQAYNEYSAKLTKDILNEINNDGANVVSKVEKLASYIKSKKVPAVLAFQPLVNELSDALKNEALNSSVQKKDNYKNLQEGYAKTSTLLKWLNSQSVSKLENIINAENTAGASKHYDPTHPGHLHESPNGNLYHQPGDNGPFSGGSYNNNHYNHNNHNNHNSYNNYPYNNYPSTYYPPQYPSYPQPNYYPSTSQIEHIHRCARCRRDFSYYPSAYAPTCPYCGYYGY